MDLLLFHFDHRKPAALSGGEPVAVRKYEGAAALSRLRGLHVAWPEGLSLSSNEDE